MNSILRVLAATAVLAATTARAEPAGGGLPSCAPPGAVPADAESLLDGWLAKADKATVRRQLDAALRGGRWEGDTYVVSCTVAGRTSRVESVKLWADGKGVPEAGVEQGPRRKAAAARPGTEPDRRPLAALARQSGHSQAELEVLAGKYRRLAGTFFRTVRDEDGRQESEKDVILRKHRRMAGLDEVQDEQELDGGELSEAESAALEARIEAAQQRGDTREVMRLAMAARERGRPGAERVATRGKEVERQAWEALETAYPQLAEAAYRTKITFGQPSCLMTCSTTVLPRP